MRKMISKVKMSKMKHWFTSSSEEDGSSFSYSPKPRAKWNWDDDELSFSSGEENKGRRRHKKTRKRESPLSFETTEFTSYKNSMATKDMMESAYIFRNRRSRNRGSKLPSISAGRGSESYNRNSARLSNLPPTFEGREIG